LTVRAGDHPEVIITLTASSPLATSPQAAPRPLSPDATIIDGGWHPGRNQPSGYETGRDDKQHKGQPTWFVRNDVDEAKGFGGLLQKIKADPHRGKRLRLAAEIQSEALSDRAWMWMRVDGPKGPLAFDNMQIRPITGSTDWQRYEVVLDVAPEAISIVFVSP
jgi:hypothetical protein